MASYPPKKGVAFTIYLPILDADGDLVAGATALSSQLSGDGAAFGAGPTPASSGQGFYSIALTTAQMNFDNIAGVLITTTTGAKNTPFSIYTVTRQIDDLAFPTVSGRSLDVSAAGEAGIDWANIGGPTSAQTLSGTSTKALEPTVASRTLDVSAGGEAGLDWANIGSATSAATLSGTSTKALEPTVASRTLDVSAAGEAGIDWANIGGPTSAQTLSGTSTKAVEPTVAGRALDVSAGGEAGLDWANIGSATSAQTLSGTSTKAVEPTVAGRTLDVSVGGEAGLDWANIGSATSAATLSGTSTKALEPTVAARTLDVSVAGEAGLDWANIGGPTSAATLSGTTIGTLTTYTGNTPQTGDAFARLGAPAGVSVSADVAAVQADTDNLQTRVPAALVGGRMDSSVGALAAAVITAAAHAAGAIDANALAADVINDIWAGTALTEAYAADGAAATPAQLLYMIWSALAEFAITSTTITAKKLDGATTAMTFTLNDATNPTSRTRAT